MTDDVAIDSDVPMPVVKARTRWPFSKIAVGESFRAEGAKISTMRALARRNGQRLGRRFICKQEGEGVRVWRQQ